MKLESCVNVKNLIVTQIMCQINHELKKKLNLRKNLFGFMKKRNGEEKNRGIMFLHDLKKRLICFVEKSSNLILIYFSCHPNLFIGFNHILDFINHNFQNQDEPEPRVIEPEPGLYEFLLSIPNSNLDSTHPNFCVYCKVFDDFYKYLLIATQFIVDSGR